MRASIALLALLCSVQASLSRTAQAAPPTMPLDQVVVGAHGHCRTVLRGTAVESLPFEVRGILPAYLGPHRGLIVIRLLGEQAEFTGVAQGMSGSPCLIDGRVIGALSYSLAQFNKEPIAGVTPIDDMLNVLALPRPALLWRQSSTDAPKTPTAAEAGRPAPSPHATLGPSQGPAAEAADWRALLAGAPSPLAPPMQGELVPLGLSFGIAGMGADRLAFWRPYLESHRLFVGPGASAGSVRRPGNLGATAGRPPVGTIEPGGSVAAVLVHGDVDMAGTGTVSWVDNGQVLAFGHPFFQVGPVSMPMATARIVQVLASSQLSRKLPVTGDIVGEFTHDRLPAIAGTLGPGPSMVGVTGRLTAAGRSEPFQFEVSRDGFWTPRFLLMALDAAIAGRAETGQRGTIDVSGTITLAGSSPLTIRNVAAAGREPGLALRAVWPVAEAFAMLWRTEHEPPPEQAAIELEVVLREDVVEEHIRAVRLPSATAAPGEEVRVVVELESPDAPPHAISARLLVPPLAPEEHLQVIACNAAKADELTASPAHRLQAEADDEAGQLPKGRAARERLLRARHKPGSVYVLLMRVRGKTHTLGGEAYADLPPSSVALTASEATVRPGAILGRSEPIARPGEVRGHAEAKLTIERPFATVHAATMSSP